MKVLIIGGNRFFGKRLAAHWATQNAQVTLLNRGNLPDGLGDGQGDRIQRITLDRKQLRPHHPALGDQTWDIIYDQVCYDAAEAAAAVQTFSGRTRRYVFISSQSVYGPGASLIEGDFDPYGYSFSAPVSQTENYGEAKRQAEATFFRAGVTMPVTAVRFPIVLGPDDYTLRLQFHVDRIRAGQPIYFPNLEARISFIQSSDAADFLTTLAQTEVSGPINVCAEAPIALREVVALIERAVGKKANLASTPETGEASPFGIRADWSMDTRKLTEHGFRAVPIKHWLPSLIA